VSALGRRLVAVLDAVRREVARFGTRPPVGPALTVSFQTREVTVIDPNEKKKGAQSGKQRLQRPPVRHVPEIDFLDGRGAVPVELDEFGMVAPHHHPRVPDPVATPSLAPDGSVWDVYNDRIRRAPTIEPTPATPTAPLPPGQLGLMVAEMLAAQRPKATPARSTGTAEGDEAELVKGMIR
jgi:hypothetical protein